jgi:antitoxin component YwqK of YwqJK toxin-antitoxin module
VYEGDWKNGTREGKGVHTWSKEGPYAGQIYDGEYKNDLPHGIAIYTYPSGEIRKEEWEDGKMKRVIEVLQQPTKVSVLIILLF